MAESKREFKGVWFPAQIWLDERLTALEKIILIEIDSLDGEDGCYASNEYLAGFCQCSQTKVSSAISKLKKLGYVKVASFDGRKRVLHSCIAMTIGETDENCESPLHDSVSQTYKNCESPSQNLEQRVLVETTRETTNNKKKEGKRAGYDEIIDSYTENGELRSALVEFVKMRKMMKKPLTNKALSLLLTSKKGLDGLASTDAEKIDIVQQSMMRGWLGFFPLKDREEKRGTVSRETTSGFNKKVDADYYYQSTGDEEVDKVLGLGKYAPKRN